MSGFSFGFSGDDIDIDDADVQVVDQQNVGQGASATSTLPELVQAQRHEMNEWVSGCYSSKRAAQGSPSM
jgi:protein-histidine N-methyltransferase